MSRYRQISREQAETIFACGGAICWSWHADPEWTKHPVVSTFNWDIEDLQLTSITFWIECEETL